MWVDQLKSKDNKAIPGPIWFLFLWVNEYFPEFYRDYSIPMESVPNAPTYGLRYKTVPFPTFSAFQLADRLFKMPPRLYLEICPFIYCTYGPDWVQIDLISTSDDEVGEAIPHWSSALTG